VRLKEFESVHGGMSKSEVIEIVGGPQRTQRWHGRDRWEYRFYNTREGDVIREVHFEDGKSTYVGSAIKPAISADEQDRINDVYNGRADSADAETAARAKDGISVQKFHPVDDDGDAGPVHIEPATGSKPSTSQ
jgi:outer membrane protein assembly factor BamE (lipoprotein component of BamABCDE complex)